MRRTLPPSAEIEKRIDELLAGGVGAGDAESPLSELAKLIIQRAVEEEFDAWLGRARYERRPEAEPGKRNGYRPRRVRAAEGELRVEVPQVREAAEPYTSKLFPRGSQRLGVTVDDGQERGLVFACFVASISRQFEAVQVQWLNDGNIFHLGHDKDFLLGDPAGAGKMTVQGNPPFILGPQRGIVTTRGGEYLFVPGITALAAIADGVAG